MVLTQCGHASRWMLVVCTFWLAACGGKRPDADDWQTAPNAQGVVERIPLPDALGDAPAGLPATGPVLYSVEQRALLFPFVTASIQATYRYDIQARRGTWLESRPQPSTDLRPLFRTHDLYGGSRSLRDSLPEPVAQPFGTALLDLTLDETSYSRTWYNVGFPFGKWGWMTEHYGDGSIHLRAGDSPESMRVLLSQTYRANNFPFLAGWTPDGRYVVVVESLDSATWYRGLEGKPPALRFALFGPFEVEANRAQIADALARADEVRRQRVLDDQLRTGKIAPERRYGPFYKALVEAIRTCPELTTITGPIEALRLDPRQTLGLTDGHGAEDGLYFTFELQAARGTGTLQAAAFYPETPESVRREISRLIVPLDLEFDGRRHALKFCGARTGTPSTTSRAAVQPPGPALPGRPNPGRAPE